MQKRAENAKTKKIKDRSMHSGARKTNHKGTVQLNIKVHRLVDTRRSRNGLPDGWTMMLLILINYSYVSHKLMRQSLDVIELHELLLALVLLQHNPILQLLFLLIQILVPYDLVPLDGLVRLLHDIPHVLR